MVTSMSFKGETLVYHIKIKTFRERKWAVFSWYFFLPKSEDEMKCDSCFGIVLEIQGSCTQIVLYVIWCVHMYSYLNLCWFLAHLHGSQGWGRRDSVCMSYNVCMTQGEVMLWFEHNVIPWVGVTWTGSQEPKLLCCSFSVFEHSFFL